MKVLYLDCFSGISGDMTVGALVDLGVKPSTLEWELSKLEIGHFHMHFDRAQRQNIEGTRFSIHEGETHTHDQDEHDHEAHHVTASMSMATRTNMTASTRSMATHMSTVTMSMSTRMSTQKPSTSMLTNTRTSGAPTRTRPR